MNPIQRMLLHVTALYILLNGSWMTLSWFQDESVYKDQFPLIIGICSIIFGFIAFIISFLKFDNKDN